MLGIESALLLDHADDPDIVIVQRCEIFDEDPPALLVAGADAMQGKSTTKAVVC